VFLLRALVRSIAKVVALLWSATISKNFARVMIWIESPYLSLSRLYRLVTMKSDPELTAHSKMRSSGGLPELPRVGQKVEDEDVRIGGDPPHLLSAGFVFASRLFHESRNIFFSDAVPLGSHASCKGLFDHFCWIAMLRLRQLRVGP
jgi:hypothetical protein